MGAHPSPGRAIWRRYAIGQVKRWHTHGTLIRPQDVAQHSHGVTAIVAMLHPDPSARLLKACAFHDFGEKAAGDMPYWAKRANPEVARQVEAIEQGEREKYRVDFTSELDDEERRWLDGADLFEAWLFLFQNILHNNEMVRGDFRNATRAMRNGDATTSPCP